MHDYQKRGGSQGCIVDTWRCYSLVVFSRDTNRIFGYSSTYANACVNWSSVALYSNICFFQLTRPQFLPYYVIPHWFCTVLDNIQEKFFLMFLFGFCIQWDCFVSFIIYYRLVGNLRFGFHTSFAWFLLTLQGGALIQKEVDWRNNLPSLHYDRSKHGISLSLMGSFEQVYPSVLLRH